MFYKWFFYWRKIEAVFTNEVFLPIILFVFAQFIESYDAVAKNVKVTNNLQW